MKSTKRGNAKVAQVGVIMGSQSDWETMKHTCDMLDQLHIPYEKDVISAHRTPHLMATYATEAQARGLQVIIAGAGGAAHLPGMVASQTHLPVIGVPIQTSALDGMDSLLSIVQMPGGIPTATMAIGKAGAINAALFAGKIIALTDDTLAKNLQKHTEQMQEKVEEMREELGNETE